MTIQVQSVQYFPSGIFRDRLQEIPIKDAFIVAAASTNNQQVVAAVSGKILIGIGLVCRSAGVQTSLAFRSASGGTIKISPEVPPNTAGDPNLILPPNPLGWFRTNLGEGIFVDNPVAVLCAISLSYIEVTP